MKCWAVTGAIRPDVDGRCLIPCIVTYSNCSECAHHVSLFFLHHRHRLFFLLILPCLFSLLLHFFPLPALTHPSIPFSFKAWKCPNPDTDGSMTSCLATRTGVDRGTVSDGSGGSFPPALIVIPAALILVLLALAAGTACHYIHHKQKQRQPQTQTQTRTS